jgi:hypothetical protein
MIGRIIICIFIISMGVKVFSDVSNEYKYRPNENAIPEKAGVVFGTGLLCYLVYYGFKRKNYNQ